MLVEGADRERSARAVIIFERRPDRIGDERLQIRVAGGDRAAERGEVERPGRAHVAERRAAQIAIAAQPEDYRPAGVGARVVDGQVTAQPRLAASAPEWKSGWFEASNVPLAVLIGKVQCYSARPILLEDRGPQALPISGRFHISDTDRALQAVKAAYQVDVAYGKDAIAIRPAGARGNP